MKYSCDMIRDLLPLYHDDVCSESSKKIVEEHLSECDSCKDIMAKINDNTYEKRLQEERENVVDHYTKKVKRKSLFAGLCIASILMIPILVCLIVNIATGHALDWFFIVLTALMVFASLTVIPLVIEDKKFLWTLGSFTTSLMLLLLTCDLYSNGDWFLVASVSTLFGLSVVFLPYLLYQLPLKGFLSRNKGLFAMIVDTILLYAVIVVCGWYGGKADYWRPALLITTVCISLPWVLFAIIRYLKSNKLIKAGICVIIVGLFSSLINDAINWIIEGSRHISLTDANLQIWQGDTIINANSYVLTLTSCCIIGAILLLIGIARNRNTEK